MKILVIQQKMIGDVLTSTIVCEALKKKYPEASIHYLINSNTKAMVVNNPFIDTIVEFKPIYRASKKALYLFLKEIRAEKYDEVYDIYNKIESYLVTLFSGADKKYGYKKWYSTLLFTDHITRSSKSLSNAGLAIENRLRFTFSEQEILSNIIAPKLYINEQENIDAKNKYISPLNLPNSQKTIMISVLGSEKRKSLPAKTMAKLIDHIALRDVALFFNYAPNQKEEALEIYKLTQPATQEKIYFDVFASSLREFLALMKNCDALVGNEGGAVNMAKALDKPTFSIFSPWIIQDGWNLFEDGIKHKSIHLKQFKPEIFEKHNSKSLKEHALKVYLEFDIQDIVNNLNPYLDVLLA